MLVCFLVGVYLPGLCPNEQGKNRKQTTHKHNESRQCYRIKSLLVMPMRRDMRQKASGEKLVMM